MASDTQILTYLLRERTEYRIHKKETFVFVNFVFQYDAKMKLAPTELIAGKSPFSRFLCASGGDAIFPYYFENTSPPRTLMRSMPANFWKRLRRNLSIHSHRVSHIFVVSGKVQKVVL